MNRKQRYLAGVQRLMRSAFHAVKNERGNVVIGSPPKLITLEHGGRSFNLNEKIALDPEHIERDLTGYLEAIRYQATEIFEKYGPNSAEWKEALAKVQVDVKAVLDEQQTVLKDYRDHLRQIPDPADKKTSMRALERLHLRYDPTAEAAARTGKHAPASPYLSKMSRAQFNLTCQPVGQMGLDDPAMIHKVERYQLLHDVLSLAVTQLAKGDAFFHQNGGWESLPFAAEYKALALELGAGIHATRLGNAVNETNADEGKNWVPGPILSGRIFPRIEEELRLLAQFETIPMTALQQDSAVLGAHKIAYKLAENVADDGTTANAKITPSLWVTKKWSLVAKLYAAGAVATPNWLQDAIAGANEIMGDLAYAMGYGLENWLVNGQLTAALDTVTIGTNDIRKMGDGLRYWLSAIKTANPGYIDQDFGAGMTAEGLVKIFGQQGSFGTRERRCIWIANPFVLAQLLVLKSTNGDNVLLRVGDNGDRATVRTGEVGQLWGRSVFSTGVLSQTMGADGLDAGTGDRSVLLHIFTEGVKRGQRLGMQIDMSSDYRFLEYQQVFRAVARDDIAPVYDPTVAGNTFIGQGANIAKLA